VAGISERVLEDLHAVVGELEGVIKSAAGAAGECTHGAEQGLKDRIEGARDRISDIEGTARKLMRRGLRTADRYARDNVWQSLGAVAAVAFLAGLLVGRRN
jgi:ElaB/YqjD/DUF883 family membrane-anchored ribosome-binding protein